MIKKIATVLALILFLIIFIGMTRQIVNVWQSTYRLDIASEKVADLQKQNIELTQRLSQVTSINFIEEQARDKLNMARSGETVVIIGQDTINKESSESANLPTAGKVPNWQAWLNLFFH